MDNEFLSSVDSRDISIPRPATGKYYLLVEAKQSFHELLITAIMDTPPGTIHTYMELVLQTGPQLYRVTMVV